MPQGAAGASTGFLSVMKLIAADLENILIYLPEMSSDDCHIYNVATLAAFFARMRLHKLKLSLDKSKV